MQKKCAFCKSDAVGYMVCLGIGQIPDQPPVGLAGLDLCHQCGFQVVFAARPLDGDQLEQIMAELAEAAPDGFKRFEATKKNSQAN